MQTSKTIVQTKQEDGNNKNNHQNRRNKNGKLNSDHNNENTTDIANSNKQRNIYREIFLTMKAMRRPKHS
jgi:hypothetical protein